MPDVPDLARALVARHEGCRLKPYVDTVGKITIGYGVNLTDRGISQQTAEEWLERDVAECIDVLKRYTWFEGLNAARQTALIDLMFNVGAAGFAKFVKLRRALLAGDYQQAAAEILDSRLAPGRRAELALMMRTGREIPT